ncbi:MAG: SDR family oxidoreductase [Deinococcota bacterium]|jgi:3-oxoacyl-[acyl-carrier protein] reductase|nr:SDR family oxidoreductase [Deinococcota bacterium]MDQ3460593.1 SDR family oxidoreductase [Deinococcota bacterium]
MRLQDKIAIITGGGSGFGAGIAKRFAEEGAKIIVNDIAEEGGERVAAELREAGGEAVFVKADVSKSDEVKRLVGAAVERFGGLDIMVNNAGITHRSGPMLEVPEEIFDRVYAVNVKSLYLAALHAVPVFRERGGGVFINVASTAGVRPRPGLTWYNGSKGAAITITKSMAAELAPEGIRVNAINPVMGETGLLDDFIGGDSPEKRAKVIAGIPLGRLSRALDIANATLFLASSEAEFITGVCLEVDGGRCI